VIKHIVTTAAIILAISAQASPAETKKTHSGKAAGLPQEAQYYSDACADHWSVPRELMRAVMIQESGGNPNAVAKKNANPNMNGRGLMQLLPSTAARYGVANMFSPGDNACGGAHYLSDLMREFGDLREVVAAYYCGEHHIERKGLKYSNPDVAAYVKSVRALYIRELKKEGLYDDVASR
jgi:soluble lytic murein transglycosylase-like protein